MYTQIWAHGNSAFPRLAVKKAVREGNQDYITLCGITIIPEISLTWARR
jgi:hypothetical protein